MKKETIVIGLGNPLMGDEGIAIELIRRFQQIAANYQNIEFVDAGTGGMSLLHLIEGRKKAIIIDCASMDLSPGTIRKFTPDQVKTIKKVTTLSMHEPDVLRIIEIANQLDQCPGKIIFFGIEPAVVSLQMKLSDILAANINNYIAAITEELNA